MRQTSHAVIVISQGGRQGEKGKSTKATLKQKCVYI
jgi:hypothetical protein